MTREHKHVDYLIKNRTRLLYGHYDTLRFPIHNLQMAFLLLSIFKSIQYMMSIKVAFVLYYLSFIPFRHKLILLFNEDCSFTKLTEHQSFGRDYCNDLIGPFCFNNLCWLPIYLIYWKSYFNFMNDFKSLNLQNM
jgi:hypothetical protein